MDRTIRLNGLVTPNQWPTTGMTMKIVLVPGTETNPIASLESINK